MGPLEVVLLAFWILSWGVIALIYGHAVILSFFGIKRWTPNPDLPPRKRLAVVIPAHNEAKVLGALLRDLENQSYPRELFDIYVVADNCKDGTADVARQTTNTTVIVRTGEDRGKGRALRLAISTILDSPQPYDAFVFFDADNRVSRNFLQRMNTELCNGHPFIQGYLGTKNPTDNWVTRVIYESYCMTNRLWQLGKRRAGLPSQCGGTGFCVETDVLRDLGWPMTSITEDLEMVCLLAQKGIFPVWCHDAVVYDEKPTSVRVALRQRVRWMRGHFTNMFRFFVPLLKQGVAKRDVRLLDCAIYLLYPMCVLAVGLQSLLWLLDLTLVPDFLVVSPGLPLLVLVIAMLTYYPALGIYLETRSIKELAYLPLLLAFNWIWVVACFTALFTLANREWYHTPHDATLDSRISL